jgi:hypothetical protein
MPMDWSRPTSQRLRQAGDYTHSDCGQELRQARSGWDHSWDCISLRAKTASEWVGIHSPKTPSSCIRCSRRRGPLTILYVSSCDNHRGCAGRKHRRDQHRCRWPITGEHACLPDSTYVVQHTRLQVCVRSSSRASHNFGIEATHRHASGLRVSGFHSQTRTPKYVTRLAFAFLIRDPLWSEPNHIPPAKVHSSTKIYLICTSFILA